MRAGWAWSLLLVVACQPADGDTLRLGFTVREAVVADLVGGTPVFFGVEVLGASRWDLFGVRGRGCPEGGTYPPEPVPWTTGFSADPRLRCDPEAPSCGSRTLDPFCCRRVRVKAERWCELDLLTDVWGDAAAGAPPPGALVLDAEVPETGGRLDAWLQVPALTAVAAESLVVFDEVSAGRVAVPRARPMVVELGTAAWAGAVSQALLDGQVVSVRPGEPSHDALVEGLLEGAALYLDDDEDGFVDDDERASGVPLTVP